MSSDLAQRFYQVQKQLAHAASMAQRELDQINLLAVSKTRPVSQIKQLYQLGQRHFGENQVQEASDKIQYFQNFNDISWHFIGKIQRNKTKLIAQTFDWVHSIDRLIIAERLSMHRDIRQPKLNICLQVNIDDDPNKSGFKPDEVKEAIDAIVDLPHLHCRGLMTILANNDDPDYQSHYFEQMSQLYLKLNQMLKLNMDTLSMGMSNSLNTAIAHGANWVRIGSAIFGPK